VSQRWLAIAPVLTCAAAGCGHEPSAPPGSEGALAGVWVGSVQYEDMVMPIALWLEEDGATVVGTAAQLEYPPGSLPVSADADDACLTPARTATGTLGYRMPTIDGPDLVFAISLDGATHQLIGEWAADTEVADISGDVVLVRRGWLATRERDVAVAQGTRRVGVALGCIERPPVACTDGVDNDGDGRIDADDPACCRPGDCALIGNDEAADPSCGNGLDDDGDGAADAGDPECWSVLRDELGDEPACSDGGDNDLDGLVDLADPGCAGDPRRELEVPPICADGLDNDADGLADAADPECAALERETPVLHLCQNGYDDDGDGRADLDDPTCQVNRPDEHARGTCDDGIDNDADGATDLEEPTCTLVFQLDEAGDFGATSDCDDGVDNDADGATDASDPQCYWYGDGDEVPTAPFPVLPLGPDPCANQLDDDADGLADGADPDCVVSDPLSDRRLRFEDVPPCLDPTRDPDCRSPFTLAAAAPCSDGLDNDLDGLADLADPSCFGDASGVETRRQCADGQDNDGDGAIDAADPHCFADHDWTEAAACANGRDDDGDGRYDLADPGCEAGSDDDERP
jgi:hypothetical protein